MKNICLTVVVQTPRSLATRERIGAFCKALKVIDQQLVPHKFGTAEPLRSVFDVGKAEQQLAELHTPNGSSMMFAFKPPLDGMMSFNTARGPRVLYNGLKARIDYASVTSHLAEMEAFIKAMFESLDAAYACAVLSGGSPHSVHVDDPKKNWGEVNGFEVPPWNPSGLQSLPGICWINVFGPEYAHFIGEDVLTSLGAKRLNGGKSFWLQPTERPKEMLAPSGLALASSIKARIGKPRAFYGYDPSVPSFRARYESPTFNYSEIQTQSNESALYKVRCISR